MRIFRMLFCRKHIKFCFFSQIICRSTVSESIFIKSMSQKADFSEMIVGIYLKPPML